ncbi:YdaU family protein [Pseudoduganella chitinolytica]|uniref:YdaU family protein n=1 Tax=Pseudoduganella chitinolytica TaxID=34070 RepID=A0ABY8BJM4_9BURK|nr:YdaU family protein [Pseudoduganella chitinolytica]WEF34882.1 YdaU family protein [Pseudoduganella chitinolytica]
MNYYSHHIGDYTTDTAHLSLLEDGAYRRLMDRYYTTEAPLPADEAVLFRVVRARMPDEQEAVRVVLAEFFDLTDAGWTHKRCDAEIEAFKAKSGKAADAANKRWGKTGNAPAMPSETAPAMPTQCERNANAMPTNNQEPIPNKTLVPAGTEGGPDGQSSKEPKRSKPSPTDEDYKAARWVFEAQQKANPSAREPSWFTWANDIRLLREVDGRTHKQICELFRWAKADKFWSPNIQSPGKLREKWDQLSERKAQADPVETAREAMKDVI